MSEHKIYALAHRSLLRLDGPDAAPLLQGLITQDTDLLQSGQLLYALLLNATGRIRFDLLLWQNSDGIYLEADAARLEELSGILNRYKLRRKVEITDMSDKMSVYACAGATDMPALAADTGIRCFRDPRHPRLGYRCYAPTGALDATVCADTSDYKELRLALTVPEGADEIPVDKAIPLEWGMENLNAVSWTKGCYLGQELTARTKHLGIVRKSLVSLRCEGTPPAPGSILTAEGKEAGTVRITGKGTVCAMVYHELLRDTLLHEGQILHVLPQG